MGSKGANATPKVWFDQNFGKFSKKLGTDII